ncbi:MAG: hypothetical protein CO113_03335 [Elusimicrobia bacterium CG_4_9_14_3_um_filter_62_55]|nr:MAG: hypothetical protein COX66_06510 [Elusimicrobia bacterium CG_4_10_14_0_2_um_filter_63_34]PJB26489.1 MAG: hypothetical protein CO113_03335 [Elusimicrobia bacterium CG_4_9_14_3_um_filter_62_55]
MALKQILDTPAAFQANAGSQDLDLTSLPIRLTGTIPLNLIDDFDDGIKDPKWVTVPEIAAPFFTFAPIVDPVASGMSGATLFKAQTFTVAATRQLFGFGAMLISSNPGGAAGEITCELQTTTGPVGEEQPSGTVIAVANSVPASSIFGLGFPPAQVFTRFEFPDKPELTAGVKYAVVLKHVNFDVSSGTISWYAEKDAGAQYPDGKAWTFANGIWNDPEDFNAFFDFYFELLGGEPNPRTAVETGGSLQFDYPDSVVGSPSPDQFLETVCDLDADGFELQTQVRWEPLNPGSHVGLDHGGLFSVAILKGNAAESIANLPLSQQFYDDNLVAEMHLFPDPEGGNLSFRPIVVDAAGNKLMYTPPAQDWVGFSGQGGFFDSPFGNSAGVPYTIKIDPQAGGGLQMTVFKNNDPAQQILQTSVSPPVRAPAGAKFHIIIGHARRVYESRYKFTEMRFSGDLIEAPSGSVSFKRSFGSPTKVTGFTMERVLPAAGDAINVRLRGGDDEAELQAAAFSEPIPTEVDGDIETGTVNLPAKKLIEYQLEFIAASPGPLLNSFDITTADEAVEGDRPLILSLDEVGPGRVTIQTSEGEADTPNTDKLKDSDAKTQYESADSTDGNEVAVEVFFQNPEGGGAFKNFNAVLLRNTNLKRLRLELGPVVLFDGEITSDDELLTFPTTLFNGFRLVGVTTKTPNEKKKIGEVYAGIVQLALLEFDEYEPRRRIRLGGSYESLGGKLISFAGVHKYASRWVISRLNTPTKDALEAVFAEQRQITFWPEPKARPRDIFDVAWTLEELPFPYSETVKGAGHTVEAEMVELTGRS